MMRGVNRLKDLWDKIYKYGEHGLSKETVEEVLDIIEKRIPKKELIKIIENDEAIIQYKSCPFCETEVSFAGLGNRKFCYNCGQALESI